MNVVAYSFCVGLFTVLWITDLGIGLTQESFRTLLPHLISYNDISIESVVILGHSPAITSNSHPTQFCETPDKLGKNVTIWSQYINVEHDEDYFFRLTKLLEIQRNTLIIVCDNNLSKAFYDMFQNIPDYFFFENTWLFIYQLEYLNNIAVNITEPLKYGTNTSLTQNFKLDSQIYIIAQNNSWNSLYEAYKPCPKHQLVIKKLVEFNDEIGCISAPKYIWNRRHNLMGCEITSAYVSSKHEMYEAKTRINCKNRIRGSNKFLCIADRWHTSLVKELKWDTNMTIRFITPADNEYGVKVNGEWTGVVGMLSRKEADVSFVLLSFTVSRGLSIDFSTSMGFSYIRMYMPKPELSISYVSFLSVFSIHYWLLLLLTIISIAGTFSLFGINRNQHNISNNTNLRRMEGIGTGIWITYRALLGLDVYTSNRLRGFPTEWSSRVCLLTVCLLGMLNINIFYAGLASLLTIESSPIPINSLKDVSANPNYHLGILKGTKTESFFSDSKDLTVQEMWKNREHKIIFHTDETIAEKQILIDSKLIYVGSESFEDVAINYPCKITRLSEKYARTSYGFGFSPNSSYFKLFNYKFSQYKSFGIKHYLEMRTTKASTYGCVAEEQHWHSLGYANIYSPFGIFCIGTVTAVACLFAEKIMQNANKI